jgi:hypothetical protein
MIVTPETPAGLTATLQASALAGALDRVEEVIDHETDALNQARDVDLAELARRKSHCLLELTRISRAVPRESVDRTVVDRLALLRGKLERNQDVLLVHLNAAQEISRVLTVALGEAESDGTYSRQAAQTGVGAPS